MEMVLRLARIRSHPDCRLPGSTLNAICECDLMRVGFALTEPNQSATSDNSHGRVFENQVPPDKMLTVESCISACQHANLTVAGLEFSTECCEATLVSLVRFV
jgi:hypothetical protein